MQELVEQLIDDYGISHHEARHIIEPLLENAVQNIFLRQVYLLKLREYCPLESFSRPVKQ